MQTIELSVIDGVGFSQVYATTADGTVLRIGGVDLADGAIYPGDHMHNNSDLKKLDEALGWLGGYYYSHHLASARDLLSTVREAARRVGGISDV